MNRLLIDLLSSEMAIKNMADAANSTCILCGTVVTGFEAVAISECKEKLNCRPSKKQGKIYFEIPVELVGKAKTLRSVEHLFVVVKQIEDFGICNDDDEKETVLKKFYELVNDIDWDESLEIWRNYSNYVGPLKLVENSQSQNSTGNDDDDDDDDGDDNGNHKENNYNGKACKKPRTEDLNISSLPRFRVTCSRTGSKHNFSSMDAAASFGGAINDLYHWRVDLSNADIEILLYITNNTLVVGIALTRQSLGKRNIQHFGPTTLKSSLAYCLLHLASINPGDVVCDPMGGGGSIPIEGILNWPLAVFVCGDNHELAIARSLANIRCIASEDEKRNLPLDIYQWDVCNLPLKTSSVDVMVTDMPFGKKSGSRQFNWTLYPKALTEMARVCLPKTGRAVILTQDKKVMKKTLNQVSQWWKMKTTLWINMGGLQAGVYVLTRTEKCF